MIIYKHSKWKRSVLAMVPIMWGIFIVAQWEFLKEDKLAIMVAGSSLIAFTYLFISAMYTQFIVDAESITKRTLFTNQRMAWSEIKSVEIGKVKSALVTIRTETRKIVIKRGLKDWKILTGDIIKRSEKAGNVKVQPLLIENINHRPKMKLLKENKPEEMPEKRDAEVFKYSVIPVICGLMFFVALFLLRLIMGEFEGIFMIVLVILVFLWQISKDMKVSLSIDAHGITKRSWDEEVRILWTEIQGIEGYQSKEGAIDYTVSIKARYKRIHITNELKGFRRLIEKIVENCLEIELAKIDPDIIERLEN